MGLVDFWPFFFFFLLFRLAYVCLTFVCVLLGVFVFGSVLLGWFGHVLLFFIGIC